MKKFYIVIFLMFYIFSSCHTPTADNKTAVDEQTHTEANQRTLLTNQPLPDVPWSMERDNLIKLKKLQNDRTINFYMYVFNEGVQDPIGYYQVNKVSSVDSQLSNPEQMVYTGHNYETVVLPSPSEDGSYGTNGNGVFGFTPEDICIQTNMHYICATVPLHFNHTINRLAIIDTKEAQALLDASKKIMNKK